MPRVRPGSPAVFDDLTACFSASASRALRASSTGWSRTRKSSGMVLVQGGL